MPDQYEFDYGSWCADVGFNEGATTGDILFVGELSTPAHLGYVTLVSTLAAPKSLGFLDYSDVEITTVSLEDFENPVTNEVAIAQL